MSGKFECRLCNRRSDRSVFVAAERHFPRAMDGPVTLNTDDRLHDRFCTTTCLSLWVLRDVIGLDELMTFARDLNDFLYTDVCVTIPVRDIILAILEDRGHPAKDALETFVMGDADGQIPLLMQERYTNLNALINSYF